MKITRTLLFIVIFSFYFFIAFGQNQNKLVSGLKYKGVIFDKSVKLQSKDTVSRWTPSDEEIEELENGLTIFMKKQREINQIGNCPIIAKNLNRYIRQYAGYISPKGEKMIYVNCFWYEKDDPFSKGWEKKLIKVFDGCSYYWQIHFNLSNKKFTGYAVNGVG